MTASGNATESSVNVENIECIYLETHVSDTEIWSLICDYKMKMNHKSHEL